MNRPAHPGAASARRPRKPWYRTRNLALALLLLAAAWLGKQVHWAFTAQPTRNHTYGPKLDALIAKHRPAHWPTEGEDATQLLESFNALRQQVNEELAARFDDFPEPDAEAYREYAHPSFVEYFALYDPDAPPVARREALTALARMEELGANDLLDRIAATRTWVRAWPEDTAAINARLPYLGTARNAARYATARFVHACESGDEPTAIRSYEHALTLAALTAHNNTMIDRLVAIAIMNLITQELMYQLVDRRFSPSALAQFHRLTHELTNAPPVSYPIESERITVLDTLELFYAPNGRMLFAEFNRMVGTWNGVTPGIQNHDIANLAGVILPTREETAAILTDFYDRVAEALEEPPLDREAAIVAIDMDDALANPVGQYLIPALSRYVHTDIEATTRVAVIDAVLAIERYAAETGSLPVALTDIPPDFFVTGKPPLNPETGEPFTLVQVTRKSSEADQTDPRRYLLAIGQPMASETAFDIAYNERRPNPEPKDETESP